MTEQTESMLFSLILNLCKLSKLESKCLKDRSLVLLAASKKGSDPVPHSPEDTRTGPGNLAINQKAYIIKTVSLFVEKNTNNLK